MRYDSGGKLISAYERAPQTKYVGRSERQSPYFTRYENIMTNVYEGTIPAGMIIATSGMSAVDFVSAMKSRPMDMVVGMVSAIPLHFWGTCSASIV